MYIVFCKDWPQPKRMTLGKLMDLIDPQDYTGTRNLILDITTRPLYLISKHNEILTITKE